jgi:hypothetical protein
MLGNRELGWECWTGKEVMEYTSKQLKDIIKAGKQKVCGLKIGEDGELELDEQGFYCNNLTVHTHVASWHGMNEESMANLLYTCIGSHEEAGKTVYDCISSRWEQTTMTESDMRAYLRIGIVASGAKLDGEKIVVASTELEKKAEEPKVTEEPKQAAEPKVAEEPKKAEAPKVTEKATAAKAAGKEAGKEKK